MAYRYTRVEIGAGVDSSMQGPVFGPFKLVFDQTKDLQTYTLYHRLLPTDAEFTVPISTSLSTVYYWAVISDYPIMVRLITAGTAQQQLRSNNAVAVNIGSPLPDQCIMFSTGQLLNNYLAIQPITSAAAVANVKIFCSGDPVSAYV